jgi:2'-5' RNA ligase
MASSNQPIFHAEHCMPGTIRTFIAFSLPDHVKSALNRVQEDLKACGLKAQWVRLQSMHLTLKFLGNIEIDQVDPVAGKMAEAVRGIGPLLLGAKGVGVFPNIRRPRVIWAGLAGDVVQLGDLQRNIDAALSEIGFAEERRSFKGHLTMGRFKGRMDSRRVAQALEEFSGFETQTFTAQQLVLFKSQLEPTGAVYSQLKKVPL